MGLQLISIEYVTKKNHCQAAGEETNIFYHPLVFHLKRVHLQYLHHHRRTLFSSSTFFVCSVVIHGLGMGNKRYIHKFDLENCAQTEQTVPGERQFVMAEPVDFANYVYL